MATVRTTVVLPERVAKLLKEHVPARKRSQFIAESIEQRLIVAEQKKVFAAAAGAWKDEDHPDLMTYEDIRRYLAELRSPDAWRTSPVKEPE